MGTLAELALWHEDPAFAERMIREVRAEVGRLNGIFNLLDDDSEISRFNRDGCLVNPTWEVREVVTTGCQFSEFGDEVFDITVRPLSALYARHFWTRAHPSRDIDRAARQVAERSPIGLNRVVRAGTWWFMDCDQEDEVFAQLCRYRKMDIELFLLNFLPTVAAGTDVLDELIVPLGRAAPAPAMDGAQDARRPACSRYNDARRLRFSHMSMASQGGIDASAWLVRARPGVLSPVG